MPLSRRVLAAAALGLILGACSPGRIMLDVQAPATLSQEPRGFETAEVGRVIDGDTVEVRITARTEGPGAGRARVGGLYDVRLIGIDTPESVMPGAPVECFGPQASTAASALLDGATVRLVKDVEEADGFDRLLRYVYMAGEMANARLVVNGYARAHAYSPNLRHSELLAALQRWARDHDRGLWGPAGCSPASPAAP